MFFIYNLLLFSSLNIAYFTHCNVTVNDTKHSNLIVGSIGFKRISEITEICEVNDDFLFRTNDVQLRMNLDKFECLTKIRFNGLLKTTTLTSLSVKQWILWEVDRFNLKDNINWIPNKTSFCGNSNDSFLGGPCNLATGSVKRFYNNLPIHTEVKITGRVHFFDEWNESHNWCASVTDSVCKKFGIDVCGTEYPDRLSVNFEVSMAHDANSIAIEFYSTLDSNAQACDVSWGIDDIALYLR